MIYFFHILHKYTNILMPISQWGIHRIKSYRYLSNYKYRKIFKLFFYLVISWLLYDSKYSSVFHYAVNDWLNAFLIKSNKTVAHNFLNKIVEHHFSAKIINSLQTFIIAAKTLKFNVLVLNRTLFLFVSVMYFFLSCIKNELFINNADYFHLY